MAGHSKWNNIKRRKEAQDSKRAKIFTKISKEIFAAVREAGADPSTNLRLRLAIQKAKAANIPGDNIDRTVKRASGEGGGIDYQEMTYEGYGPGGVAILVKVLTDNRNRTVAELRHAFSRNGGNLGEDGCVAFLFTEKGILLLPGDFDEDTLMLTAIEAGADEFERMDDGSYVIWTEPSELEQIRAELERAGYTAESAEITSEPTTWSEVGEVEAEQMERLIDMLEDNDDVQDVYYNWQPSS